VSRSRRIVRIALVAMAAVVALVLLVGIVIQTSWGGRRLAQVVAGQIERALDAEVSIGRISGNLLTSVTIDDLAIAQDGDRLIAADRVQLRYDLAGLVSGGLAIEDVTVTRPIVRLVRGPDGITLFNLFAADEPARQEPTQPFAIAPIRIVDGLVLIGEGVVDRETLELPRELRDVQATLAVEGGEAGTRIRLDQLSFVGSEPRLVLERLSGGLRFADEDIVFEQVVLQTEQSRLTLDGSVRELGTAGGQP
jgi:autotransporter translocation and assembly factor TamB